MNRHIWTSKSYALKKQFNFPPRKTFLKAGVSQRITMALMTNMFTCLTAVTMGKGCSEQLTFGEGGEATYCLPEAEQDGDTCVLPACRKQETQKCTDLSVPQGTLKQLCEKVRQQVMFETLEPFFTHLFLACGQVWLGVRMSS